MKIYKVKFILGGKSFTKWLRAGRVLESYKKCGWYVVEEATVVTV